MHQTTTPHINLQPTLANDLVTIVPLQTSDFERLYSVASDPLVWEQHPNKDRYKREVFENFFEGAMASKGAFLVLDNSTGEVIGSSRYYDLDLENKSVFIGYTFLARACWGGQYNRALKKLMLDHAFTFANKVLFHIGKTNIRSQTAMERLGGKKIDEISIAYYGEATKTNFVYEIALE